MEGMILINRMNDQDADIFIINDNSCMTHMFPHFLMC